MKVRMPLRATAVAAALVLGLAACGGGSEDPEPEGEGSPAGEAGGEYIAEITEPTFLAPASNCYESECSAVLDMINDPLVTTNFESGELEFDGLAESIEPNDTNGRLDGDPQGGPHLPERRAGRLRGLRPGVELLRQPEERSGDRGLRLAHPGRRRRQGDVRVQGHRRAHLRGHPQRPVLAVRPDAVLRAGLRADAAGVPRRPQGVQRAADRHRSLHDGRPVAARRGDHGHQVGGLRRRAARAGRHRDLPDVHGPDRRVP